MIPVDCVAPNYLFTAFSYGRICEQQQEALRHSSYLNTDLKPAILLGPVKFQTIILDEAAP